MKILLIFILFWLSYQLNAQHLQLSSSNLDFLPKKEIFQSNYLETSNYSKTNKPNLHFKNFLLSNKEKYKLTFSNNFLFLIPPLAWNLAYGSNNPAEFDYFKGNAPKPLIVAENIFRFSSMTYPFFLPIDNKHKLFKPGMVTYLSGLALYFGSWAYLIKYPKSKLSKTTFMRFAPAYTPIIWLTGMSLMSKSKIQFTLSFVFIALHITEYVYRYQK